jgi:hypothetical protein
MVDETIRQLTYTRNNEIIKFNIHRINQTNYILKYKYNKKNYFNFNFLPPELNKIILDYSETYMLLYFKLITDNNYPYSIPQLQLIISITNHLYENIRIIDTHLIKSLNMDIIGHSTICKNINKYIKKIIHILIGYILNF